MNDDILLGSVLPVLSFFVLGAVFGWLERINPARDTHWRRSFSMDILGFAVALASIPVFATLTNAMLSRFGAHLPRITSGPEPLRAALYFVLSDVARYASHRAMHSRLLWRTHRFHHSPTQLYWFSGNRASLVHIFMFLGPQLFLLWFCSIGKVFVLADIVIGQLWNHIMHTNWNPNPRWQRMFEWVVTTPRYHAIHHSADPAHANANLAAIFTVWDRIFGHYVDPDSLDPAKLEFGLNDSPPAYRLVLGA